MHMVIVIVLGLWLLQSFVHIVEKNYDFVHILFFCTYSLLELRRSRMINKQNLWFLTLFSLILVLSVYYITMPNDLLTQAVEVEEKDNKKEEVVETVEEISSLTAMRVSLEEERQSMMDDLQEQLTSDVISSEEKNNAYEQLKYLNTLQSKEEELEKKIKKELKLDSFVKIDNNNVSVVCVSSKHDNSLANNIMRLIQSGYEEKMYITVKFQKA